MQYDIRLRLLTRYRSPAVGGRHQVHVAPLSIPGIQRVVASSIQFEPRPADRSDFADFFGNPVTAFGLRGVHAALDVRMTARVLVTRPEPGFDVSPSPAALDGEIAAVRSLGPAAPHHFLAPTRFAQRDEAVAAYVRESLSAPSVTALADEITRRIHDDFTYDGDATTVTTTATDAFKLKRGVCQDFSHVMIAGLRGVGIPAGYVSGFLRTIPPAGKRRLEGADAMHAWVRVWCGREAGWQEFDPTNAMRAGNDHIVVGYGRDYGDVAPIVGVLKTAGGQVGAQAVDVIPLDA